jgi:hypothetical protein
MGESFQGKKASYEWENKIPMKHSAIPKCVYAGMILFVFGSENLSDKTAQCTKCIQRHWV